MPWTADDLMAMVNGNALMAPAQPLGGQVPQFPGAAAPMSPAQPMNPLLQMAQQMLPQFAAQMNRQQAPRADPRALQRLLVLQGMQQSPFYQGQNVGGAGSQILQALMPILMARAQGPLLEQQMNAQYDESRSKGMKTLFDAFTAMMGLQTAQAQSEQAQAGAQKARAETSNIPIAEARRKAAAETAAENARQQREMMQGHYTAIEAQGREANRIRSTEAANTAARIAMEQSEKQSKAQWAGYKSKVTDQQELIWVAPNKETIYTGIKVPKNNQGFSLDNMTPEQVEALMNQGEGASVGGFLNWLFGGNQPAVPPPLPRSAPAAPTARGSNPSPSPLPPPAAGGRPLRFDPRTGKMVP